VGALLIEDLVSRRWLTTVVSSEETHTQVQLAFEQALEAEGLLEVAPARAEALGRDLKLDGEDELTPILLAVSDNGSQMISANTRKLMALFAITQHFGRPSTPTVLRAELDTVRDEHNTRISPGADAGPQAAREMASGFTMSRK